MLYYEYALTPDKRRGTMVPRTALADIYSRPDSGYCTAYAFDGHAAAAIRAQGDSKGLGRFPVYSDRLWIDFDADVLEEARQKARDLATFLKEQDHSFTVWFSGGKGYHVCIKIEPMKGRDVPYSQSEFVKSWNVQCDYSLYQHGRLLSNPGRLHPKTGIKKHKVMEWSGSKLLSIPVLVAPQRDVVNADELTDTQLATIALSRAQSLILDAPMPGMRHTSHWSAAMQMFEAGMDRDLVFGILSYADKFSPNPKSSEDLWRAVSQAQHQSGR